jgi:hypothetical protein
LLTQDKIYLCRSGGGYKTTIETLPVETIEWMKHPRTNRGAQVRIHAKRLYGGWVRYVEMPNEMIKRKVYCQIWVKSKGKCQER